MRTISGLSPRETILNLFNSAPAKRVPTLATLAQASGVSTSCVVYHLNKLYVQGFLNKEPRRRGKAKTVPFSVLKATPIPVKKTDAVWDAINTTHALALKLKNVNSGSLCTSLALLADLCNEYRENACP